MDFITQSLMAAGGVQRSFAWKSINGSTSLESICSDGTYIYVCGIDYYTGTYIAKYEVNGELIWAKSIDYGSSGIRLEGKSIVADGDAIYFVSTPRNAYNCCIHKYDLNGNKIFEKLVQFPSFRKLTLTSIAIASTFFVCAGYVESSTLGSYDIVVIKYDKSGNILWKNLYGTSSADYCYDICIDTNNSDQMYLCGSTVYSTKTNGLVVKIDSSGAVMWSNASLHSSNGPDVFYSIQVYTNAYTTVGYAAGKTYNSSTSKNEGLISVIDGTGITATRRKIAHSNGIVLNGTSIDSISMSHPSYYGLISGYIESTPNKGFFGMYNTTTFYQGGKSFASSSGTDFRLQKVKHGGTTPNYKTVGVNGSYGILIGLNSEITDGVSATWGPTVMAVPTITDSTAAAAITTGLVSSTAAAFTETTLTTSIVSDHAASTSSCYNYSNKV